jgi:catechol 2,3-dioxygenase-like lactoylglutathione lyase family enzyme
MPIRGLDHYALLSSDAERTTRFYVDAVGLQLGERPELSFPGIWLYADDRPIVHIIFGKDIASIATGAVDHLAFVADGSVEDATRRLQSHDVGYTQRTVERTGVVQVFCRDPDGVGIELNFMPAQA